MARNLVYAQGHQYFLYELHRFTKFNCHCTLAVFSCTFVVHLHVLSRTQTGITDWVRATENKIIEV